MNKIAIHCETREDFDRVCKLKPYFWRDLNYIWREIQISNKAKIRGCINISKNHLDWGDGIWYLEHDYKVITATEYFKDKLGIPIGTFNTDNYYFKPKKEESKMKKYISEVFEKTQDALLVEKWSKELFGDIPDSFLMHKLIYDNASLIVQEVQRLEEESKKD